MGKYIEQKCIGYRHGPAGRLVSITRQVFQNDDGSTQVTYIETWGVPITVNGMVMFQEYSGHPSTICPAIDTPAHRGKE